MLGAAVGVGIIGALRLRDPGPVTPNPQLAKAAGSLPSRTSRPPISIARETNIAPVPELDRDRPDPRPTPFAPTSAAAVRPPSGREGARSTVVSFNGIAFASDPRAAADLAAWQRHLAPTETVVALIGWRGKPGEALQTRLLENRIHLLDYVPPQGWIARIEASPNSPFLAEIDVFKPLDPKLRIQAGLSVPPNPSATGDLAVYIHPVRDRPVAGLLALLAEAGFVRFTPVSTGDRAYLAGSVAAGRQVAFLQRLGTHPDVQWIEPAGRAHRLNDRAVRTLQSGSFAGTTPYFEQGIFGTGQVIGICDSGVDIDSCFFRQPGGGLPPINRLGGTLTDPSHRKVIAVDFLDPTEDPQAPLAWDQDGHGTAVAGCAAGSDLDAPWDPLADNGMAPGAQLIIQDAGTGANGACTDLPGLGCPVTHFYPALVQARSQGARIHNNSWGDEAEAWEPNHYTQTCRELDLATWLDKELLVICAAGNQGLNDTVGSPSTAKNALSVAATQSGSGQERIAGYSSRGWASDGRFKPDLAAPGHGLRTAASDADITTDNCYRLVRSGTSFASPLVAGAAALVRDYFAQGFHPTGQPMMADRRPDVSAALVKAVLLNATVPLAQAAMPPPARDQGWGRPDLSRALKLGANGPSLVAVDGNLTFAQTPAFPYQIRIRMNASPGTLKVTLVWTDYPAAPGADIALVNDLDLRVRTPQLTFKGNHWIDGQSAAGGAYDRLNNVEQVEWIPDPNAIVEISVWAHRIVVGPQDFALVIRGDFDLIPPDGDTDQDRLPDDWELWHFGDLAQDGDADPDQDGVSNRDECATGSAPDDPQSHPRLELVKRDAEGLTLRMIAGEGRQYTLERASEASPQATWQSIGAPLLRGEPLGESTIEFSDPFPALSARKATRYYRVRIDGPPAYP